MLPHFLIMNLSTHSFMASSSKASQSFHYFAFHILTSSRMLHHDKASPPCYHDCTSQNCYFYLIIVIDFQSHHYRCRRQHSCSHLLIKIFVLADDAQIWPLAKPSLPELHESTLSLLHRTLTFHDHLVVRGVLVKPWPGGTQL